MDDDLSPPGQNGEKADKENPVDRLAELVEHEPVSHRAIVNVLLHTGQVVAQPEIALEPEP